jgi:threonylcarbamoyladenosine tRNA methylthiotransferase MtaB
MEVVMPSFAISTLGCKVNLYESESYQEALLKMGYQVVDFDQVADIYIINTCSVTNMATNKSRKMIQRALRLNPQAIIAVVGCYVETYEAEVVKIDGIDILVGAAGKGQLAQKIDEQYRDRQQLNNDLQVVQQFESLPVSQFDQTRAYLKVQDGCNQYCAYCIIPFARGSERSMPLTQALEQAKILSLKHQEIVLAGIHTGRYGYGMGFDLVDLLKGLCAIDGLQRIRLSSIEITEVTDELLKLMVSQPKIATHLHIPLQSGCDDTLKMMNRPYTTTQYAMKLASIRQAVPNISISTDVIVGFPTETQSQFEQTFAFIQQCDFSFLHVFPYSPRAHTKAMLMTNVLNAEQRKARSRVLLNYSAQQLTNHLASMVGRQVMVLIEKHDQTDSVGHCSEYYQVQVKGIYASDSLLPVKVIASDDHQLYGEIVYAAE